MTNEEILQTFSDINHAYNNSTKYDTLKRMLDELEPCGDCISRKALLEEIENGIKAGNYEEGYEEYPHINDMDDILECIKYADSVQPKPKTDVLDKIRDEKLPSAQPEIIRCKDCRYYQDNNDSYPHINCKWDANETPDADDFCSGAERRTDG